MIMKLTQIVHIHDIKPWVKFWPCMTSHGPGPDFTYFVFFVFYRPYLIFFKMGPKLVWYLIPFIFSTFMKFPSIFKPNNGFYSIF